MPSVTPRQFTSSDACRCRELPPKSPTFFAVDAYIPELDRAMTTAPRKKLSFSSAPSLALPPDFDAHAFRRLLLAWYRRCARDLPWRRTRDPYRVWLSEIMLQQTRVETVLPYYRRFLARFPMLPSLAAADLHEVLELWAGLGYYARARHLHRAAHLLATGAARGFPDSAEQWRNLPGVGRSTAAAVASIVYDEPAAVLDGNVKRVLARLFAVERPLEESATQRRLWRWADQLLDPRSPGDHNQAMMELGARVCTPRNPECSRCPVRSCCRALRRNLQNHLPRPRTKKAPPLIRMAAAAVRQRGRFLMIKRPADGPLAGHWQFPAFEIDGPRAIADELLIRLRQTCKLHAVVSCELGLVKHAFTHRRYEIRLFLCKVRARRLPALGQDRYRWIPTRNLDDYALTALDRKLAALAVKAPASPAG